MPSNEVNLNLDVTDWPKLDFELMGADGNAFAIIGRIQRAARREWTADQVKAFTQWATSGDYHNLVGCALSVQRQPSP